MLESEYGKAAVLKTDYNGYASRYSVFASLGLTGNQVPVRHTEDAMVPYELREDVRWKSMILEVSLVLLSRLCIMVTIEIEWI